jgi:hypothetical protein
MSKLVVRYQLYLDECIGDLSSTERANQITDEKRVYQELRRNMLVA